VQSDLAGRAYASDGDTLHLNGQRVRLLGIDAPELEQMCRDKADISWPCGQVAKSRLNSFIGSAERFWHPSGHDKYGHILAACDAGGDDLGAAMMRDGLAVSYDGIPMIWSSVNLLRFISGPCVRPESISNRIKPRGQRQHIPT
jgi:endonuclease YncB( thermonuclease family)